MAIISWNPYVEVSTIASQLDRLFDDIAGVAASTNTTWKPAVELQDNGDSLTLKAELPGIEGKDLDVSVTRDAVALRGEYNYENKSENNGFFRSEFRYGKFDRVVNLPVLVQNDKVEANFTNGILTLTLPKIETAKNRVVKVNLADTETTANPENEQAESN